MSETSTSHTVQLADIQGLIQDRSIAFIATTVQGDIETAIRFLTRACCRLSCKRSCMPVTCPPPNAVKTEIFLSAQEDLIRSLFSAVEQSPAAGVIS
ncbi:MAG: hypothetical protein NT074_02095 [Methanomicrobiales archaeon]|nr:hypothetical protein [Methanomicrobiales archaeon]